MRKNAVISIHALLAESDMSGTDFYRSAIISIHALLAESDLIAKELALAKEFLSTLSLRRATQCRTLASGIYGFLSTLSLRRAMRIPNQIGTWEVISIHALLAESE